MLIMVGLIIMLSEFVVIVMRVLLIMLDRLYVLVSVMRESVTHELIEVAIVRLILAPKLSQVALALPLAIEREREVILHLSEGLAPHRLVSLRLFVLLLILLGFLGLGRRSWS